MTKLWNVFLIIALLGMSLHASALILQPSHYPVIEFGTFRTSQGDSQNINKVGLVGDRYQVIDRKDSSPLFGLGYLVELNEGPQRNWFDLAYGLNIFYLPKTEVKGITIQEQVFPNLSHEYSVTHVPIYAIAKANFNNVFQNRFNNRFNRLSLVVDAGLGPNFMKMTDYKENSLDGITLPDNAFKKKTDTTLSAMAGIGLRFNNVFANTHLECGFRLFYLGNGELKIRNPVVIDRLKTGDIFAQSILCSAII